MIFELVKDFADVLDAMPAEHPRQRIVKLLDEAIRRDGQFIDQHPTAFFQCMWNACWWYDCSESAKHYEGGRAPGHSKGRTLSQLLERWRSEAERQGTERRWLRSLRPPRVQLAGGMGEIIRASVETNGGVRSISVSSCERQLASCSLGEVQIWDLSNAREVARWEGGRHVRFSPDGRWIANAITQQKRKQHITTLEVRDAETFVKSASFLLGRHYVYLSFTFSPDGNRIACLVTRKSRNHLVGILAIVDLQTGKQSTLTARHPANLLAKNRSCNLCAVEYSPCGQFILTGASSGETWLWDARTGNIRWSAANPGFVISSVCFSTDGASVAVAEEDGRIRIRDAATGAERASLHGHDGQVTCVSFSEDGTKIVGGGVDGTVRIWSLTTAQELNCLRGHDGEISEVEFLENGTRVVSAGCDDSTIRFWSISPDVKKSIPLIDPAGKIIGLAASRAGTFAIADREGSVHVRNLRNGKPIGVLTVGAGHKTCQPVERVSIDFSQDGVFLATGTRDGFLTIWDVSSNLVVFRTKEKLGVNCLTFSSDGKCLVWSSGTSEKCSLKVVILKGRSGNHKLRPEVKHLSSPGTSVFTIALSPDSRSLAMVKNTAELSVVELKNWNAGDETQFPAVGQADFSIDRLAFSPDGNHLVISGLRQTAVIRLSTNEFLEIIEGIGDVSVIAGETKKFALRMMSVGEKTIVERNSRRDARNIEQLRQSSGNSRSDEELHKAYEEYRRSELASAAKNAVAVFPELIAQVKTDRSGDMWVGCSAAQEYLYLLCLEGPENNPPVLNIDENASSGSPVSLTLSGDFATTLGSTVIKEAVQEKGFREQTRQTQRHVDETSNAAPRAAKAVFWTLMILAHAVVFLLVRIVASFVHPYLVPFALAFVQAVAIVEFVFVLAFAVAIRANSKLGSYLTVGILVAPCLCVWWGYSQGHYNLLEVLISTMLAVSVPIVIALQKKL